MFTSDMAGEDSSAPMQFVGDFSDADYYSVPPADSEPGVATGFGIATMIRLDAYKPAVSTNLIDCFAGNKGYVLYMTGSTLLSLSIGTGSTGFIVQRKLTPSDIGKIHAIALTYDGAKANIYLDRTALAGVAGAYAVSASPLLVGRAQSAGSSAGTRGVVGPVIAFRGVPTAAEIYTLLDEMVKHPRRLPRTMAGATITRIWSARKFMAPNEYAAPWSAGPAMLADTATGNTGTGLAKTGSPKYVPVFPDPAYSASLNFRGVQGFASGAYLRAVTRGIVGAAAGLTVVALLRFNSSPSVTHVVNCSDGGSGWGIYSNNNLSFFIWGTSQGFTFQHTLNATADLGRVLFVAVTFDGSTWRAWLDGVRDGSDFAGGFSPSAAAKMTVGCFSDNSSPATESAVFAVAGCNQALSDAEIKTMWRSFLTDGKLTLPAGKTSPHSYDFEQDFIESGVVPTTFRDRLGTDNLTRTGTLYRARRVAGMMAMNPYPFTYGLNGFTDANYYSGSLGTDGGVSNGKSWAALFRVDSQALGSRNRAIFEAYRGSIGTLSLYITGTNLTITPYVYNAGGTNQPGASVAIAPDDVGRLILIVVQFDKAALMIRTWSKRVQVGNGISIPSFPADGATSLYIGRRSLGANGYFADGITVLGVMSGDAVWTRGEIEQLFDDVEAAEELVEVSGKTSWLYIPARDVYENGGAANGAPPALVNRAPTGTKTLTKTGTAMTLDGVYGRLWTH